MGNTADLAMVQKMIIDTLHKEGKSQTELGKLLPKCNILYITSYCHLNVINYITILLCGKNTFYYVQLTGELP